MRAALGTDVLVGAPRPTGPWGKRHIYRIQNTAPELATEFQTLGRINTYYIVTISTIFNIFLIVQKRTHLTLILICELTILMELIH